MPLNDQSPDVSLVIPVYRAGRDLQRALEELEHWAARSALGIQLIFVDDGSHDGTEQHLLTFAEQHSGVVCIRHQINQGKGRTVADGVAAAAAPIIIFTDADIPYDLSVVEQMVRRFDGEPGVHMLVGSRNHLDSVHEQPYGPLRRVASWTFTHIARAATGVDASDVQCGVKGFRKDAARLLFSDLVVSRFAFDVELFLRAQKFGLRFQEVPVIFRHAGPSTVKLVPSTLRMLRDLWRLYVEYRHRAP